MTSIGNITATGLWVGSVKADFAFIGNTKVWEETTPGPAYDGLVFIAKQANSTVKLNKGTLQYSLNDGEWQDYTNNTTITLENVGDYVGFKAKTTNSTMQSPGLSTSGALAVQGNMLSLIDGANYKTMTTAPRYGFEGFFQNNTAIYEVSNLYIGSTIEEHCCYYMFNNCSNLSGEVGFVGLSAINGANALDSAFRGCAVTKIDYSELATVNGNWSLCGTGDSCKNLKIIDMSSLSSVQGIAPWNNLCLNATSFEALLFSNSSAVPALNGNPLFSNTNPDFVIVVPDALYDTWVVTSGWSTYADHIIRVSDYVPSPTKVKYTVESGLPDWESMLSGVIAGTTGQATSQIPNVSYAINVELGNQVTGIGDYAFYDCSNLSAIAFNGKIRDIGDYAFRGCDLADITIANNISSVGDYAFEDCETLSGLVIGNKLSAIGVSAFNDCTSLSSVDWTNKSITTVYNTANYPWGLENGTIIHCSYGELVVGQPAPSTEGWTKVKYTAASGFSDWEGDIVGELSASSVPNKSYAAQVQIGSHVTSLGDSAFQDCTNLTSVTIPGGVTSIGINAFSGCSGLTSVTIPSSVTTINTYAFRSCSNLTNVTIQNGVPSIGGSVFLNCSGLRSITIPSSVTSIGNSAFAGCGNLTSVTMTGKDIQTVQGMPQYSWNLTNGCVIHCTNGYITIGTGPTYYTTRVKYTTASGLPDWEGEIVGNISGTSGQATTQIPNIASAVSIEPGTKVTGIGDYAFYHCSNLSSITMIDEIGSIGSYAFDTCTGLNEITLSSGLSSMAETSFDNCSNLSSVNWTSMGREEIYYMTNYPWGLANGTTFHCEDGDLEVGQTPVHVPYEGLKFTALSTNSTVGMSKNGSAPSVSLKYSTDDGRTWSPFTVGTTTVTLANIGDEVCFKGTNEKMSNSYNSDYNYFVMSGQIAASGNINSLLNGRDPDAVTTCPEKAYTCLFQGCYALVDAIDLMLPSTTASINSYGHGMFRNCTNLVGGPTIMATNLLSGTYTAENMFYGCSSLTSVKIYATGSTWNSMNTQNWMYGVPSTGTFYYNGTYTRRGASYIPTGWTITPFTP